MICVKRRNSSIYGYFANCLTCIRLPCQPSVLFLPFPAVHTDRWKLCADGYKMRLMWIMCCGGHLNQRMQLHLFHKYLFISKIALILIRREKSLLNCVWIVLKSHLIIWSTFRTQLIVENNICDIFGCIALLSHHLVVHFSDCLMLLSEYIREM